MLGARIRAERKARGWSLGDAAKTLTDLGVDAKPGTLGRMEDGSRPGDPKTWGKLWELFGLPLRELYEGLAIPVPDDLPGGLPGEILGLVQPMDVSTQQLVLTFARHAPAMAASVQGKRTLDGRKTKHPKGAQAGRRPPGRSR